MTDKEQIEEMAKLCCPFQFNEETCFDKHCNDTGCWALPIAEELYNAGYHKTIWHKVADDDLPQKTKYYYCHYKGIYSYNGEPYERNHEIFWNGKRFITESTTEVIAWLELPEYKE